MQSCQQGGWPRTGEGWGGGNGNLDVPIYIYIYIASGGMVSAWRMARGGPPKMEWALGKRGGTMLMVGIGGAGSKSADSEHAVFLCTQEHQAIQ